jgi:hypothetical protein
MLFKRYWLYSEYPSISRHIAKKCSLNDILKNIERHQSNRQILALSHLKAIERSSSMASNSAARAHARNSVTGNYAKLKEHKDALEIYLFYPEETLDADQNKNSLGKLISIGEYLMEVKGLTHWEAIELITDCPRYWIVTDCDNLGNLLDSYLG